MYKRKLKLSSLYGQMVSAAKKPLTAFDVCAKQVRQISCKRCLHYEKCKRNGSPVSMLGRYLAWLNLTALKPLSYELSQYCVNGLKLQAYAPDIDELKDGAYVVIRAYTEGAKKRLIFRLYLQGDEDEAALRTLVFNAYIRAKKRKEN